MNFTGIVRKVDELGRIGLPAEIRRILDIEDRDELEIHLDGNSIVLRKYHEGCVFCDGTKGVEEFRGKNVCVKCRKELTPQAAEKKAAM